MLAIMRDFEDSTLWCISEFERARCEPRSIGYTGQRQTQFASSLQAELDTLQRDPSRRDVLELIASLRRHGEAALVYLAYQRLVWPMTVFPREMVYHSPHNLLHVCEAGLATLKPLRIEPPGVLPPHHWKGERDGVAAHYRPLAPVLWAFALKGPRKDLLAAISGSAAYRTLHSPAGDGLIAPGAMGAALERLGRGPVALRELAALPGMNVERGSRLLNGLYLVSNLMVTRVSPAARREPLLSFLHWPRG